MLDKILMTKLVILNERLTNYNVHYLFAVNLLRNKQIHIYIKYIINKYKNIYINKNLTNNLTNRK
jgi:hypothetical protein